MPVIWIIHREEQVTSCYYLNYHSTIIVCKAWNEYEINKHFCVCIKCWFSVHIWVDVKWRCGDCKECCGLWVTGCIWHFTWAYTIEQGFQWYKASIYQNIIKYKKSYFKVLLQNCCWGVYIVVIVIAIVNFEQINRNIVMGSKMGIFSILQIY